MKKKIAILALFRGGIGHYIAELSPFLSQYFDLYYISYKYGLPGDEVTMDDPAIEKNLSREPQFLVAYNHYKETIESLGNVIDYLKDNQIDVLNIHVSTMTRETVYFVLSLIEAVRELNIKIHFTFHDVGSFEDFSGSQELLRAFYQKYDTATVGNEPELEKLTELGVRKENVAIARHGLYTIFDFGQYTKESAREHLGISQDAKIILNFGILRDYKGFDDSIRALPEIKNKIPQVFLLMSAGVRVHDSSQELIDLVNELNLGDSVKLSFEFINSAEMEPIFKAADIVVLPYRQVSQSGILNIALNFRVPVIISNLFTESSLVNNNFGLVVDPEAPEQIAEAATKLLSDSEFYSRCRNKIDEHVKNDATWQENAQVYKSLIEDQGN